MRSDTLLTFKTFLCSCETWRV